MNWKKAEVIFEFLMFGIIIGITEDLVAIKLTTDASITAKTIFIVVLLAIPFAFLGEIVVDHIDFSKIFERFFSKNKTTGDGPR